MEVDDARGWQSPCFSFGGGWEVFMVIGVRGFGVPRNRKRCLVALVFLGGVWLLCGASPRAAGSLVRLVGVVWIPTIPKAGSWGFTLEWEQWEFECAGMAEIYKASSGYVRCTHVYIPHLLW